jgi:hypothetical protein
MKAVLIMAAVCFSHWLLDLIVHVRDLPLIGNRFKVGFGLWNHRVPALLLELVILLGGAAIYIGSIGLGSPMGIFTAIFALLLAALQLYSIYGPPPTAVRPFAASALLAYVVIAGLAAGAEALLA